MARIARVVILGRKRKCFEVHGQNGHTRVHRSREEGLQRRVAVGRSAATDRAPTAIFLGSGGG